MPGADDLNFKEYADFTAGLWARGNDRECPPNGLLELTDAYPLPSGGLRAAGIWQAMTTTNLPTNAYVLGVWSVRGTGGTPEGLYVATLNVNAGGAGNHTFQLFKLSGSLAGGSWTSIGTVTGCTGWNFGNRLVSYRTGAASVSGTIKNYFQVYSGVGANDGIYSTDGTTMARTITTTNVIDLQSYQSRLIWAELQAAVYFTDPGVDTLPDKTVNFTFPLPEIGGNLRCLQPVEPSDLLVHKGADGGVNQGGMILLQGDITAPIIRQTTFNHRHVFMYPAWTDYGMAWTMHHDGVYLYNEGTWSLISQPILGAPMQPNYFGSDDVFGFTVHGSEPIASVTKVGGFGIGGASAYWNNFLCAGQGYMWDSRTSAWFTVTIPNTTANGQASHFCVDQEDGGGATSRTMFIHSRNFAMNTGIKPLWSMEADESDWTRASSYVFTLPLIYQPSFQTVLRQIEYHLYSFVASSTISVSVSYLDNNGVVQTTTYPTITLGAATSHKVLVDAGVPPSDWVKIRTTMASPTGEAPMIELIRVGTQDSHPYSFDG